MAMVNVSLDTDSRQVVLTVNGMLVSVTDVSIEKYKYSDGEEVVRFAYTIESTDVNGMQERRQFYLPAPQETVAELNENGMASKQIHDDNQAKADVIDFLKRRKGE